MSQEFVAALIVQSQMILLGLRSAARAFYPDVWDMFGGHMEPGEQQHHTLVRELQEELDITPTQWTFLETLTLHDAPATDHDQPSGQFIVHLYLVSAWAGTPVNRQPEEHSAIGWFSLAQAIQLRLPDPSYPMLLARYLDPGTSHPSGE